MLAARFFPLVHYELSPNPKLDKRNPFTRLRSLRFDYRLQLYIDRHHDQPTNAALKQLGNARARTFSRFKSRAAAAPAERFEARGYARL